MATTQQSDVWSEYASIQMMQSRTSAVTSRVALSGIAPTHSAEALAPFTHVLSIVLEDHMTLAMATKQRAAFRLFDAEYETLPLAAACAWISAALAADAKNAVLVHCHAGMSRSAAVVVGYLMKAHRMTLAQALAAVRAARPIVDINEGFMRQLRVWDEECQAEWATAAIDTAGVVDV